MTSVEPGALAEIVEERNEQAYPSFSSALLITPETRPNFSREISACFGIESVHATSVYASQTTRLARNVPVPPARVVSLKFPRELRNCLLLNSRVFSERRILRGSGLHLTELSIL